MKLEEIKKILRIKKEFSDIDKWKFKWIPHGIISKINILPPSYSW